MRFQRESVTEIWNETRALLDENHSETGALSDQDFDPDAERYLELDRLGIFRTFTARQADELVGYANFVLSFHLHYKNMKWAAQDAMYLKPACRGTSAVRFIRWTDSELKKDGVDVVYRHVTNHVDYSRTLERLGYGELERKYARAL